MMASEAPMITKLGCELRELALHLGEQFQIAISFMDPASIRAPDGFVCYEATAAGIPKSGGNTYFWFGGIKLVEFSL